MLPWIAYSATVNARIPVKAAGIYQVTYAALGLTDVVSTNQVHVFNRGSQVAISIDDGNDGLFGAGDSLSFYGVPITESDPEFKYTDENIYWVRIGNNGPLTTMSTWTSPGGGVAVTSFRDTHHAEKSWWYWQQLPNGTELDHWFWGRAIRAGTSRDFTFRLDNVVDTGQAITLRLALQGETKNSANPDHRTRVTLNGNLLGDINWDGQVPLTHTFDGLAASLLIDGNNTLTVEEVADPNILADSIYVNWIEVDHDRAFTAVNDQLFFNISGSGTTAVMIDGFTRSDIQVYDISNPAQPRLLSNPQITSNGGNYRVSFSDSLNGTSNYVALVGTQVKSAALDFQATPPTLKSTSNGADYIIITHESLKASVAALAQHRAGQGYRVKTVTTREIFDDFSDGIFTPQAIKDFLSYAYENWQAPVPEFVVLIGDANLDYKDNYQTGQINHVPTYLIETVAIGETPSDNWFVTVAGNDPIPDMNIGRIPAKTPSEVQIITDKIITYEGGMPGDWSQRVLMATGDQDPRFSLFSTEWLVNLPTYFEQLVLNPASYTQKFLARGDFNRTINQDGAAIVSYFGHGQVDRWVASDSDGTGSGSVLQLISSADVKNMSNDRAYPFFIAFNCLNGLFAEPNEGKSINLPDKTAIVFSVPLPEALLFKKDGGALAMWSPAAFAYPSEQRIIGDELFSGIYQQGNTILGSVTTQAKVNAYVKNGIDVNNLDVFTFIGDPATRLAVGASVKTAAGQAGGGGGGGGGGGFGGFSLGLILLWFLAVLCRSCPAAGGRVAGRIFLRTGHWPGSFPRSWPR